MTLGEEIRTMASDATARVDLDATGKSRQWQLEPDAPPTVLVSTSTDALKETALGRVTNSLDRDQVWVLEGLSIPASALNGLPAETESVQAVMEFLRDRGEDLVVNEIVSP